MENNIENKFSTSRLILISGVSIVAIIVVLYLFKLTPSLLSKKQSTVENPISEIAKDGALALLPAGLPIEGDVEIKSTPKLIYTNGKQMVSFSYSTGKPATDIVKSYQKFFNASSWDYKTEQDTPTTKVVSAVNLITKDSIIFKVNTVEGTETAEVYLMYSTGTFIKTDNNNLFADFPIEKGVSISAQDSQSRDSSGNQTFTRKYTSNLSTQANFDTYTKYLTSTKWYVSTSTKDTVDYKNILAIKPDSRISVSISKTTKPEIAITLTILK